MPRPWLHFQQDLVLFMHRCVGWSWKSALPARIPRPMSRLSRFCLGGGLEKGIVGSLRAAVETFNSGEFGRRQLRRVSPRTWEGLRLGSECKCWQWKGRAPVPQHESPRCVQDPFLGEQDLENVRSVASLSIWRLGWPRSRNQRSSEQTDLQLRGRWK